jgi:hypothetical protein
VLAGVNPLAIVARENSVWGGYANSNYAPSVRLPSNECVGATGRYSALYSGFGSYMSAKC